MGTGPIPGGEGSLDRPPPPPSEHGVGADRRRHVIGDGLIRRLKPPALSSTSESGGAPGAMRRRCIVWMEARYVDRVAQGAVPLGQKARTSQRRPLSRDDQRTCPTPEVDQGPGGAAAGGQPAFFLLLWEKVEEGFGQAWPIDALDGDGMCRLFCFTMFLDFWGRTCVV